LNLELSQDIPSSDPVDQGEEDTCDTVGGASERGRSPAPTAEATVPEVTQQATVAGELRASTEERRLEPFATTGALEPVVAHVEEEAPMEVGIVYIANILCALTVTVVRSSL
jgi:hypothetical protein